MRTMRAPYTAVFRTLAGSRSAGIKTHACKPCWAACAATAFARFPVELQPTVSNPKRRAADGGRRRVAFRQGQKLGVAPHVEGAAGQSLAPDLFLQRGIVEGDFQGRKTVFAEGARGIAPGFPAFFTSQFV